MRIAMLSTLLLLAACGPKRLVMQAPMTAPGSSFVCTSATKAGTCSPSPDSDPGSETLSGSAYVNLPQDCRGAFDAIGLLPYQQPPKPVVEAVCKVQGETRSYLCSAGAQNGTCTRGDAKEKPIALPQKCDGHINKLIVRGLDTAEPSLFAVCAPAENPDGVIP